jgi:hypothetical protein
MTKRVHWHHALCQAAFDNAAKRFENKINEETPRRASERQQMKRSVLTDMLGDQRYERIMGWLKAPPHGIELGIIQIDFAKEMINACLPIIYQEDWNKHKDIICKKYNVVKHKPILLCELARRMGKTETATLTIAGIFMEVPGASWDLFAQDLDLSQINLKKIRDLCMMVNEGGKFKPLRDNVHEFSIHTEGEAKPKTLSARTPNVDVSVIFLCMLHRHD